ncbi:DUF6229 family protein [Luteimonas sp. FCS-9]|uniref:DUF6229 family protein n=1 Tax=Luteimonas sp. FCS-9 TaxID=1547516 RepID=UPI00063EA573|nr:DUF6229 family protein [Luteimonas sp. FCS-9]KLI99953.1 hypothetical protein WQ56_11280 [Luteimonas sp. FCS-9]
MNDLNHGEYEFDQASEWREYAGADNPAGALFLGGEYAEADIAGGDVSLTVFNCTNCADCTGSITIVCR